VPSTAGTKSVAEFGLHCATLFASIDNVKPQGSRLLERGCPGHAWFRGKSRTGRPVQFRSAAQV